MIPQPSSFDDLPGDIGGLLLRMNQELTCPICLGLLEQCTRTPCGHTYCRPCIIQSLRTLSKCPICKEPITKRGLSTSESVEAIVQEFLILRQHYEKDSGNNLSQLPNREYHQHNSPDDLSLLYPYPSKPITINRNPTNQVLPESSTSHMQQEQQSVVVPQDKDQEEPSTLSLLLWPPPQPSSQQQLEEQLSSSSQQSTTIPPPIDTDSKHFLVYKSNQIDPFTISYLAKLHKDGKLDLAKDTHVSSKVTHFVFATTGERGIKNINWVYLQALVLRKWIVNEQWVHQCYKLNKVVDPTPYSTFYYGDDDGQEYYWNGPKRAMLSLQNKEPPLFNTKSVWFDDSMDVKLKKQFTNLMIAGGGQVIQDSRDMTPSTVMVCQSLSKKKDDQLVANLQCLYGKRPISTAWMTQSILRYELLNEEEFEIGTRKQ
ncbi:hypothetical protein BC941DRAFT_418305 [Chlamydoabsidia padenii]|nr:hypothetical protein BC941DRAFT_418305 [Chlamydoabsidia padenii]